MADEDVWRFARAWSLGFCGEGGEVEMGRGAGEEVNYVSNARPAA